MRTVQIVLLVLIVIGVGLIFTQKFWVDPLVNFILEQSLENKRNEEILAKNDPLNTTYSIEGENFRLVDGKDEKEEIIPNSKSPGATMKITTKVFGEPVYGDLNSDGTADAALFITQNTGGTGTFYYIVEAINVNGNYKGTNAIFLGDRIAPQNINIENGLAVANFAERRADESFATPPSIGKSVWVKLGAKGLEVINK